ncbi:hypothetical protein POL68_14175 [Stigmatella sp. ncwal1]|uniref:Uncharacterized protein n=1 Tax=Stigmatella ashevillensis TaxID=2995309 RepID=A0ABT5D993_9BACT|nr:hypothetical protein [Stigmatella ashevillena]MDC0709614.1 hypothetical protein [Stigmatella ashevillena]
MSKPQPPFHDLEFATVVDFWAGTPSIHRSAFLMPVKAPKEFLAFGVLQPSRQVHFVARGRLKDHLANFLSRMAQSGAQIELYVRAPVPAGFLRRYASGPPIENQESEDPPEQPVLGLVPTGATPYTKSHKAFWPQSEPVSRRVLLAPTHEPAEFLALGLLTSSDNVLFRVNDSVQEHLGKFVTRMVKDGANVELYTQPPAL